MASVDQRLDDAAVRLGRAEQWILDTVHRRGTIGFVATMTVPVVLASVVLTMVAMRLIFGLADDESTVPALVLAMGVPALVAPPTLFTAVRLTARLDTAGRLLRRAASTDPLTGVLNRRGFFEALDELVASGRELEVAMLDVDDFKPLNDIHGHATGDLVLERVAEWLVGLMGTSGIVGRMGGDEFALVVPSSEAQSLPSRQSLLMQGIVCSVTIGTARLAAGEDFEAALARADADLYERKGRRLSGNGPAETPERPSQTARR